MIRIASHSRPWIRWHLILVPFALAACGETKSDRKGSADVVQAPVSRAPVAQAGGPGGVEAAPVAPRAVTYEDAEAAFHAGKFAEARDLFLRYVDAKPENPWGYYMLGLSSWRSGDFRGAEAAFDAALALDPKHVKSLLNSARVLMDLKRDHEALERIHTARGLDSTSSEALRLLGRAHHRLGDVEAAVLAYRAALVADERDAWAMNNLGMLNLKEKDPATAIGPLARAVQLQPGSPVFRNNLGMALELSGYLVEAKQAYEDAVRADSTYAKAVANAERLGEIVTADASPSDVVMTEAELFRQWVRMWKDVAQVRRPQ
jgi:Flp pilus assembly protein TadD